METSLPARHALQDADQFCLVLRQQVYQVRRGLGHLNLDSLSIIQSQDGAHFLQGFDSSIAVKVTTILPRNRFLGAQQLSH